ncbi:hypothetical protein GUITHDRAFT_43756, partial [Guillardia theta CCMP2712]
FVTVGTTKFDELVEARATPVARGRLRVAVYEAREEEHSSLPSSLFCLQYKPSLQEDMAAADLIVSHAGAGSVMESLRMGKKLVVVANQALMDNHQMELADAMAARG